jgi:hypothetical protein
MSYNSFDENELGAIQAVMLDFAEHRLPRLNSLYEHVKAGATLSEYDIQFLEDCIELSRGSVEFAERHPEYANLVSQIALLYHSITELGLNNENSNG